MCRILSRKKAGNIKQNSMKIKAFLLLDKTLKPWYNNKAVRREHRAQQSEKHTESGKTNSLRTRFARVISVEKRAGSRSGDAEQRRVKMERFSEKKSRKNLKKFEKKLDKFPKMWYNK